MCQCWSARRNATADPLFAGQADKDKHAAEEAKRWAASGQAGKDKHAGVEAKRWAASGQADKDKHTGVEEAAAKQRQSRQEQRELYAQLTRKTHETHVGVGPYFAVKGLNFFRYFAGKGAKFRENFAEI